MTDTHETIEVHPDAGHHKEPGILTPEVTMVILTWVTFFLLLVLLYKFAWKPILSALDEREKHIKKSIEDADKVKAELESLAKRQQEIISEAHAKAKEAIDQSRQAAVQAAKHITDQAKQEANIILENARRDIKEQVKEAQANLREESATIAIQLAAKIIEENLDETKSKKLISKYINEL